MKYLQIRPDWHKLVTDHGAFFGYTRAEVMGKARTAADTFQLQAVAVDFRRTERPDMAAYGFVIVNPHGNAACWIESLNDPSAWIPGTFAVDACGSVWMTLGLEAGAMWEHIHDTFAHVPPPLREAARAERLAALAFTDAREPAQC